MRRPIAMLGLAFVLILLGIVSYSPHRPKTYADLDREQMTVVGSVEWKEYKQTGGERTLVVSLEHVMVLKPESSLRWNKSCHNLTKHPISMIS